MCPKPIITDSLCGAIPAKVINHYGDEVLKVFEI